MDKYSPDTKAAVLAALLEGQSVTAVAKEYSIPEGTVKSWKSRQRGGEHVATVAPQKRAEIGDLLMGYLEANLRALKAQAEVFADPDWIRKQDASEAAVLHGVQTDKAVRLLEALSHAADDNTTDS